MYLVLRWFLNAALLLILARVLPGFSVSTLYAAIIAAAFIGVLNAVARPVLIILTLPINILSLGLFTLVINAAIILFVSSFVKGFEVSSLNTAILAGILLWLFSWATNWLFKDTGKRYSPYHQGDKH
jgi:putative membrane protein